MRTKALLCAAVLAAGALSSMGQANVYSLNVVGYVNTRLFAGFTLICNPLNATDNHLGQILKGAQVPDNTIAFTWDPTAQDFAAPSTYVAASQTWVPDAVVGPGAGLLVYNPGATTFTNVFVGDVLQGSITNKIYPQFNLIASPVPISGGLSTVLTNIPASDNDLVFQFNSLANPQDFGNPDTYNAASQNWVAGGAQPISVGVGEGLLYYANAAAVANWVRTFTVQ
jgi:hypothetical protein